MCFFKKKKKDKILNEVEKQMESFDEKMERQIYLKKYWKLQVGAEIVRHWKCFCQVDFGKFKLWFWDYNVTSLGYKNIVWIYKSEMDFVSRVRRRIMEKSRG